MQNKVEKPVRDALIADDSAAVKVSTWGNLIDEIVDNSTYQLTSVVVQEYFGVKLTTTTNTTATLCDKKEIDWQKYDIVNDATNFCCPDVTSIRVNSFLQCVNTDETKVTCSVCFWMLLKRCKRSLNVELTLKDSDNNMLLRFLRMYLMAYLVLKT